MGRIESESEASSSSRGSEHSDALEAAVGRIAREITGERVSSARPPGYELSVESRLNVDWPYNRRLYEIWAIYDHWPIGMLYNIAGPSSDGVIIQAVWSNITDQDSYFGKLGVERFTEVVRAMATAEDPIPVIADLEPNHRKVTHLSFGPLARAFIDIGPDLDESAVHFYKTNPVAIDIKLHMVDPRQISALWRGLQLEEAVHPRMIVRTQERGVVGLPLETQVWLSEEDARAFVADELTAAFKALELPPESRLDVTYRELKRIAISSDELDPSSLADHG